ncbi:MAG: phage/plasmid primase, P4 family [Nocardioidaceae bacterium]
MEWSEVPGLKDRHAEYLNAAAIRPEVAARMGVRSAVERGEGVIFPYRSRDCDVVNMYRPDNPGDGPKYLWPKEAPSILTEVVATGDDTPVVLVEGTKQALAVASWIGDGYAVYGMNGCWGWSRSDLAWTVDRTVYVVFDADLRSNRDVYDAAVRLAETLELEGAGVRYVLFPGAAKDGIDDVLAGRAPDTRTDYLGRLLEKAAEKLPRAPRRGTGSLYVNDSGVLTDTLTRAALDTAPAALTLEHKIAMYNRGVYVMDGTAFLSTITDLLEDFHRPTYRAAAEEYAVGLLWREGRALPEYTAEPLVNLKNGMLDLSTGQLLDHDPKYLSMIQLPVEWDEDAKAPAYEAWIEDVGISDQADDLEEVASTMLDPSRTPHKAAFLYGPSRSGKSTYLRILKAVAGQQNSSAVTLQQLSTNRFMAANIYGKVLNAAADLPSAHVEDLSTFKMLTGEDPIQADRKYGQQFMFTNRALFAFSANELPTVGESTRAYAERIKPFRFGISFAGHEDQAVEDALMGELPGILVRLAAAWQRLRARGRFLETAPEVRHEFETRSDRVRQWVAETGRVVAETGTGVAVSYATLIEPHLMTSKRDLARAFNYWAQDQGAPVMGERKIIDRLTSINGVYEVRDKVSKNRGLNIITRNPGDDGGGHKTPSGGRSGDFQTTPRKTLAQHTSKKGEVSGGHGKGVSKVTTSATRVSGPLVFDVETAAAEWLYPYGTGFARLGGYTTNGHITLTDDLGELARRVGAAELVTGHNILGFDLQALARYHGLDLQALVARGAVYDTLLAARHVDPPMARGKGVDAERKYDLDTLGETYGLGGKAGDLKALAKEFGGYDRIPLDEPRYRDYLTGDVELSVKLYDRLRAQTGEDSYLAREHRVAAIAAQLSLNGFRVDTELLDRRVSDGEARKAEALSYLHGHHGVPLTRPNGKPYDAPLASKAGKAALLQALSALGVTCLWMTEKTGGPDISYDAMYHLAMQYHHLPEVVRIAKAVATVARVRTVYTTVRDHLVGDRVHPTVAMKQATGRWSLTAPGLTVIGKRGDRHHEREVFLPEPGHVILAVDLSQVDMRAVAGLSGDQAYIDMLSRQDPHTEIARTLFGDEGRRDEAKTIGHGWNYGRTVKAISNGEDLPPAVVREFDESMRERFPRLVEWQEEVRELAVSGSLLDNGFGRKMRPDPTRAYTQAPALMGQGAARDLMMEGLLRLPAEVLPMLRAQVHDEVVLSVPTDIADDVERDVVNALTFPWRGVPIRAAADPHGRNWGHVYAKK